MREIHHKKEVIHFSGQRKSWALTSLSSLIPNVLLERPVLQCWVCSSQPYYPNDKTMIIKSAWQDFPLSSSIFECFSCFFSPILISSLQTSLTFRTLKGKKYPKTYLKVSESNSFPPHFSFLLDIFQIIFWHMNKLLLVSSQYWKALEALGRAGGFIVMKNWTIWFQRLMVGRKRAYNCSKHQLNRCAQQAGRLFSAVALLREEKVWGEGTALLSSKPVAYPISYTI